MTYAPPRTAPFEGELATWGSRVAAQLIDWLILFVAIVVCVGATVATVNASVGAGVAVGILVGVALVAFIVCYGGFTMGRPGPRNGQTLGKQAVGITVTRDDAKPCDFGFGVLREFVMKGVVLGVIGSFTAGISTLVDYIWPLFDDEDRALHDMAVKTHVIRR